MGSIIASISAASNTPNAVMNVARALSAAVAASTTTPQCALNVERDLAANIQADSTTPDIVLAVLREMQASMDAATLTSAINLITGGLGVITSDYLENELLDHVMGVGAYTPPETVYLGLSTADPEDDEGGLAEPSGGSYARQSIAFNAAASRKVENTAQVSFPQATGAWGTITHWALFDAETAGNMMAHGSLSVEKGVVSGNTPSVAAEEVDVEFSAGAISNYLALKLLDRAFRNQAYAPPTIYVALATDSVGDSDTGSTITEHSGDGYARKAHSAWSAAAAGATDNTGAIEFAAPTDSWDTITYAAILDALTAGNLLFYADITDQTPDDGDTVQFPDGDLDISIS